MRRREILKLGVVPAALPALLTPQEGPDWKPLLFDGHQNQTVIALVDRIIPATDTPGARDAQVNRYLDLLLHDGPAERRRQFLEGLASLDADAIRRHSRPFVRCTPAQQTAILETLDRSSDRFFRLAKQMTVSVYYSTEAGFRELNKGGRVPSSFGCAHSEHR